MQETEAAILKKSIGEKIRYFRKKRGLSQAQLAEIANIEMKSLSRIETGHNYPQCENLVAIARALEVMPWQLYFSDEKNIEEMRKDLISTINNDNKAIPALYQCLAVFK